MSNIISTTSESFPKYREGRSGEAVLLAELTHYVPTLAATRIFLTRRMQMWEQLKQWERWTTEVENLGKAFQFINTNFSFLLAYFYDTYTFS